VACHGILVPGEANARLRLRSTVTIEDAQRVTKILEACLRKVGVDPDTGLLDVDIIATGVSKATRDKTKLMLDIIKDISKEQQGSAPLDMVLDRAEEQGIERGRAEEIVARLKRDGSIMEPKHKMLRVV
jgi:replicative DNA helicase Mcm